VLEDGRAWAVTDGAFDDALELIASELPNSPESQALALWLLEQKTRGRGMGLGSVDLRELTQHNRRLFKAAAQRVYDKAIVSSQGYNPIWLNLYFVLLKLIKSVNRRENPHIYNPHMDALIPPSGEKSGPGWE